MANVICRLPASDFMGLGLLFGDSIVDNAFKDAPASANLISGGRLIASQAVSGHRISQQQAAWDISPHRGKREITWGVVQVGVNDCIDGTASATIIAAHAALVASILASLPWIRLVVSWIAPARTYSGLSAGDYAILQDVNAALVAPAGGALASSHYAAMSTVSLGTLDAAYDPGDHLHPNSAGMQVMTDAWRAAIG